MKNSGSAGYISFIENKKQWAPEIRYKTELPAGAVFITDQGFVYHFINQEDLSRIHKHVTEGKDVSGETVRHHAYKVSFTGGRTGIHYQPSARKPFYHNYFTGNDPSRWAGRAGIYDSLLMKDIYTGIDMAVRMGDDGTLKYDLIVAPGADPSGIVLSFEGVQPKLAANGDLLITTSVNKITEKAPYCYQIVNGRRITVKSRYRLEGKHLSFDFPDGYDTNHTLIIDPELVFSTYSGATGGHHYGQSATYDSKGNMYVGALSVSTGWPVTLGAFRATGAGSATATISKYTPDGRSLLYATYYGGSGSADVPNTMRVNSKDELVIAGATNSTDLAVTPGAFDPAFNGGSSDLFIAHFTEDGAGLIGATYAGGSGEDPRSLDVAVSGPAAQNGAQSSSPCEIIFDGADNIWVVSNTNSADFPVTGNALQSSIGGGFDAVLFQLDPTCSVLKYGTYLGGQSDDAAFNIVFNQAGNIILCGGTKSDDFPVTAGTLYTTRPGGTWDGFVSVIDTTAHSLLHSTFIGTAGTDNAVKLQVDCDGHIYVLGRYVYGVTDYPFSPGVWMWPSADVFITKLAPDLSASLLSTVLGRTRVQGPYDGYYPTAFMLDGCGRSYVSGIAVYPFPGMPATPDALDDVQKKFWFCVLDKDFSTLQYASYFGERGGDEHIHSGTSRFDPAGYLYHTLCTANSGFPVTQGSWSPSKRNNTSRNDAVSFKIDFHIPDISVEAIGSGGANDSAPHCVRGCKPGYFRFTRRQADSTPFTVYYTIGGSAVNGTDYQQIPDSIVIPSNDSVALLPLTPLHVPAPTGVRDVTISLLDICKCPDKTTAGLIIYDSLYLTILTPPDTVCPGTQLTIEADIDSSLYYEWQPETLIPGPYPLGTVIHPVPEATTTYTITAVQRDAPATCPPRRQSYRVTVEPYPTLQLSPQDTSLCLYGNDSLPLMVKAIPDATGYRYLWTPDTYLRDRYSPENKFSAPPGTYVRYVEVATPAAGCTTKDSIIIRILAASDFTTVSPQDTTIDYGEEVLLESHGPAISWLWTPAAYLSDPAGPAPVSRPLESVTYLLVTTDPRGCVDTSEVNIHVKYTSRAFIPTAFSPNGDGINDQFRIGGIVFEKLIFFRVFNRFGQQVFFTADPLKGWDGSCNGAQCDAGSYYYIAQLSLPTGERINLKGDVTLLR